MSMFGLLELSRQRMHSSFFESNYQVCPHCQGKGMVRTIESGAVYVLRGIEEEGIKNRSSRLNVYVPSETAIYLLNQKRQMLLGLEQKYKMTVIISADDSIKCISDYRIERTKNVKPAEEEKTSRKSNRKPPLKKMPTTTKPGTRKTRKPQAKRITAKAITAAADAETTADAGATVLTAGTTITATAEKRTRRTRNRKPLSCITAMKILILNQSLKMTGNR